MIGSRSRTPGLLPFGLTLGDLPLGVSKLRNRVLGRVFHELGLVEQWGSGVQRMIAACRDAGLAPPELEPEVTDRQIVAFVKAPEGRATRDIKPDNILLTGDAATVADRRVPCAAYESARVGAGQTARPGAQAERRTFRRASSKRAIRRT